MKLTFNKPSDEGEDPLNHHPSVSFSVIMFYTIERGRECRGIDLGLEVD
jgi:hypothetical protein